MADMLNIIEQLVQKVNQLEVQLNTQKIEQQPKVEVQEQTEPSPEMLHNYYVQYLAFEQAQLFEKSFDFLISKCSISDQIRKIDFITCFQDEDKLYTIDGDIQAGKTKTMVAYALASILHRRKAVIIVRNFTEDAHQLISSIRNIITNMELYLDSKLHFESKQLCKVLDINHVQEWASSEQSHILVVMANVSQLSKFVKSRIEYDTKYSLYVDESDVLMNTLMVKNKINVYDLMQDIYKHSNIAFFISATHYLNWFRKGTNANRMISVKKHPDYKGIEHLEHVCLPKIVKQKDDSIFVKSPYLSYILDTLTNRELYNNHPTVLLTKCSHLVVHQEEFVRTISNHEIWKLNWVAIAYNGTGITLYHDSFRGLKQLVIDEVPGQPSDVQIQNGVFQFKNLGIMQALSYLYNNGGLDKYPRIAISAGNLASRCINFMDNQYMWHITDEYVDPSETALCVDLIQSLRICGIHKNATPLKLWTTQNVYDNITKTHMNVKQFTLHAGEKNPETDYVDILEKVKIHTGKLGDRKICKVRAPYKRVKKEKEDNTSSFTGSDTSGTSTDTETDNKGGYDMIIIDQELIKKETLKWDVYKQVIEIMLTTYGTGVWVKRSDLFKKIDVELHTVSSYFTRIYQDSKECKKENQQGVLMKKENNTVYIRIN